MKFVSGFPVALAAEQRAIVGELGRKLATMKRKPKNVREISGHIPPGDGVSKEEVLNDLLEGGVDGLDALVLIDQLRLAQ